MTQNRKCLLIKIFVRFGMFGSIYPPNVKKRRKSEEMYAKITKFRVFFLNFATINTCDYYK